MSWIKLNEGDIMKQLDIVCDTVEPNYETFTKLYQEAKIKNYGQSSKMCWVVLGVAGGKVGTTVKSKAGVFRWVDEPVVTERRWYKLEGDDETFKVGDVVCVKSYGPEPADEALDEILKLKNKSPYNGMSFVIDGAEGEKFNYFDDVGHKESTFWRKKMVANTIPMSPPGEMVAPKPKLDKWIKLKPDDIAKKGDVFIAMNNPSQEDVAIVKKECGHPYIEQAWWVSSTAGKTAEALAEYNAVINDCEVGEWSVWTPNPELTVQPKPAAPVLKQREGVPAFEGWYPIHLDEPMKSGDIFIEINPSGTSEYKAPKEDNYLVSLHFWGKAPNIVWKPGSHCELNNWAVYRKLPEEAVLEPAKPPVKTRPGMPQYPGWIAISLDEPIQKGDVSVHFGNPNHAYGTPEKAFGEGNFLCIKAGEPATKFWTSGISDLWTPYRRVGGSPQVATAKPPRVRFKVRKNPFHSEVAPLP